MTNTWKQVIVKLTIQITDEGLKKMNVSYKLLKLNRKVRVTIGTQTTVMRFRDLKRIVEENSAVMSKDKNKIFGLDYMLDVKVQEV